MNNSVMSSPLSSLLPSTHHFYPSPAPLFSSANWHSMTPMLRCVALRWTLTLTLLLCWWRSYSTRLQLVIVNTIILKRDLMTIRTFYLPSCSQIWSLNATPVRPLFLATGTVDDVATVRSDNTSSPDWPSLVLCVSILKASHWSCLLIMCRTSGVWDSHDVNLTMSIKASEGSQYLIWRPVGQKFICHHNCGTLFSHLQPQLRHFIPLTVSYFLPHLYLISSTTTYELIWYWDSLWRFSVPHPDQRTALID